MNIDHSNIDRNNCRPSGFTLVEFVIYFAITIVVLGILVNISSNVFVGKEKIEAHQEVSRNGRHAIDEIIEAVSSAESLVGVSDGD